MDENEDKYVLINYKSNIEAVLNQTFQSTQRIKLTCFDISSKYLIFGASSGGIYIFTREPCQFFKLIPSKEGAASRLAISLDEKNIGISSSKGLVLILEDFVASSSCRYQVYTEHEGQNVTSLKWHNNDLYCGDNTGKISVISLSNLLAQAIFQSPCAPLMNVDSSVVQIDVFNKYLLISTQTRAYFCDTEQQQYRQIGKKLRDGEFGGCFFNVSNDDEEISHFGGIFQNIRDDEMFSNVNNNTNVKLYLARPGARLWEANFQGTVDVTHQFRHSLSQSPSDIIHINDETNAKLNISQFLTANRVPEDFNFTRIYNFMNLLILTFDSNGIYIFNTKTSSLVFWVNSLTNIKDVKILNSLIYIWYDRMQVYVLGISSLEEIVLKTLYRKQYYLCSELCSVYKKDLIRILPTSKKIHLIYILKSKLTELQEFVILERIKELIERIEEISNRTLSLTKTLENGIVVIENGHENDSNIPKTVAVLSNTDDNYSCHILYKQYHLNRTNKHFENPEFTNFFQNIDNDSILKVMAKFMDYVKDIDGESAKSWCQKQVLKQLTRRNFNELDGELNSYVMEAFLEINTKRYTKSICSCGFPLPNVHNIEPKYYSLVEKILDSLETEKYVSKIPYLYKKRLEQFKDLNDLPLLLQFSDLNVFKLYLPILTVDSFDEIIKLMLTLQKSICLNCGHKINIEHCLTWDQVSFLMVQGIGAKNATDLLLEYADLIPKGALDGKFYQACIFSNVIHSKMKQSQSVDIMDELLNSNSSCEFDKLIKKYLHNKHLERFNLPTNSSAHVHSVIFTQEKCYYCKLLINTPILNEYTKLPCGHSFHNICLSHNSNLCTICNT